MNRKKAIVISALFLAGARPLGAQGSGGALHQLLQMSEVGGLSKASPIEIPAVFGGAVAPETTFVTLTLTFQTGALRGDNPEQSKRNVDEFLKKIQYEAVGNLVDVSALSGFGLSFRAHVTVEQRAAILEKLRQNGAIETVAPPEEGTVADARILLKQPAYYSGIMDILGEFNPRAPNSDIQIGWINLVFPLMIDIKVPEGQETAVAERLLKDFPAVIGFVCLPTRCLPAGS